MRLYACQRMYALAFVFVVKAGVGVSCENGMDEPEGLNWH